MNDILKIEDKKQAWRDYADGTMKTWNHQPVVPQYRLELLNAALGVAGETGEILQDVENALDFGDAKFIANLKGEIGDVLYYTTRVGQHLTVLDNVDEFESLITDAIDVAASHYTPGAVGLPSINHLVRGLSIQGGRVAEYAKKIVFHGKDITCADLNDVIFTICYDLAMLSLVVGTTLEDIGKANLAKLAARYPEGFKTGGGIRG